ncbi:MAG: hypothetical protein AB7I19_17810 [Planctomycetota bacterium]
MQANRAEPFPSRDGFGRDPDWLDRLVRARARLHGTNVMSLAELRAVFDLSASGQRQVETRPRGGSLRMKDVDLDSDLLFVRSRKVHTNGELVLSSTKLQLFAMWISLVASGRHRDRCQVRIFQQAIGHALLDEVLRMRMTHHLFRDSVAAHLGAVVSDIRSAQENLGHIADPQA